MNKQRTTNQAEKKEITLFALSSLTEHKRKISRNLLVFA